MQCVIDETMHPIDALSSFFTSRNVSAVVKRAMLLCVVWPSAEYG